jgi:hypothetical protein
MRYEIFDGTRSMGSVVWEAPGRVRYEVPDPELRRYLEERFADEAIYLTGGFDADGDGMMSRREDWTPWSFGRAVEYAARRRSLVAVARPVRPGDRSDGREVGA